MSKPKIFIASSAKNIAIANVFKKQLSSSRYGDVSTWKDKFKLHNNESYLETLIHLKDEFEYAIFVWAADDTLMNDQESMYAPRDNVVFESGLFMGALGTSKIFIVYDDTIPIKKPSDFLGINLIPFNGKQLKQNKAKAVKEACSLIKYEIRKQRAMFPYLQGTWQSAYEVTYEKKHSKAEETVKIIPFKNGILITSVQNSIDYSYFAYGKINGDRISGQWESQEKSSDKKGEFILIITPDKKSMYGYSTGTDQHGGNLFANWVLTKMNDENRKKAIAHKHMEELQELLLGSTIKISFRKTPDTKKTSLRAASANK